MNRTSINPIFFGVKTGVHLKIPAFCNHYHNILEQRRNWFSIPNYTSPIVQLIWMSIPYATRSNGCAAIQELHPNMHGKPVVADTESTLKRQWPGALKCSTKLSPFQYHIKNDQAITRRLAHSLTHKGSLHNV